MGLLLKRAPSHPNTFFWTSTHGNKKSILSKANNPNISGRMLYKPSTYRSIWRKFTSSLNYNLSYRLLTNKELRTLFEPTSQSISKKDRESNFSKANNPSMSGPILVMFVSLLLHFRVTGDPNPGV
jgi:hypothetical protein